MHILMVNYEWPGRTENCGGGGRIGNRLAEGLRDRGHEVTVVADAADGHYATFPVRRHPAIRREVASADPDVIHGQFVLPSSLLLHRFDRPTVVSCMGS